MAKNKPRLLPQNISEYRLIYHNDKYQLDIYEVSNDKYVNYDIYDIPVSTGLLATRQIITKTFRNRINPWCNVSNEVNRDKFNFGYLTKLAIWFWEWYSIVPPLMAFQNNKIIAERIIPYDVVKFNKFTKDDYEKLVSTNIRLWWNIYNQPSFGIPIKYNGFDVEYNPDTDKIMRIIKPEK